MDSAPVINQPTRKRKYYQTRLDSSPDQCVTKSLVVLFRFQLRKERSFSHQCIEFLCLLFLVSSFLTQIFLLQRTPNSLTLLLELMSVIKLSRVFKTHNSQLILKCYLLLIMLNLSILWGLVQPPWYLTEIRS